MTSAEVVTKPNDELAHLQQTLVSFYSNLNANNLHLLNELYSNDIEFVDPVTSHNGRKDLISYFERLLEGCLYCKFEIKQLELLPENGWLQWQMSFANKKLNAGEEINVDGFSTLRLQNGTIVYQRDYYDLGAMIYEHIPLVGRIIKIIRKKLG